MSQSNRRQPHQPRLTLNVLPVNVDAAIVPASVLPFESGEQLRELWNEHGATHFFRRVKNEIIAVPVTASAGLLSRVTRNVEVARDANLAADLVRRALIEHLVNIKRLVLEDRPVEFLGSENLLDRWCGNVAAFPAWMQIRELWEVAVRIVWLRPDAPVVMAAFGVRTKRLVEANCADLVAAGVSLEDTYVGRRQQHRDARCQPFRRAMGRVVSVSKDGMVRLADRREDAPQEIPATELFPDASWDLFDRLIDRYAGHAAKSTRHILDSKLSEQRHGPTKLSRIRETTGYFQRQRLRLLENCYCRFGELVSQGSTGFPRVAKAPPPVYVFDPNGRKTDTWHDRGLDINGPYDSSHFPKSSPKIAVICQTSKKGRVEQAVHKFLHGIDVPEVAARGKQQPFAKGFIRKYLLRDVKLEFETADSPTFDQYERAARRVLERATPQSPIHLALVQIDEQFHNLPPCSNPYLATKAVFLSNQVPVQEFEYETIDQADKQLAYTFNNMALASYAKLSGVPWLLKADPVIAHELVVGLGSATISESRLGTQERVVGITTLFSGDGQYYLSNVSKSVPFQDYPSELLESIRTSVDRARRTMNWQEGDHVRLVFHGFKPLKDDEAKELSAMMKAIGNYHTDCAFLHLAEDHPYLLFDEAQQGEWYGPDKAEKGVYAPERGRYIQLSRSESLLTMTGPRDVKRPSDGLPRPLLLRLHRESTFADMPYLTTQVARFAQHSWRSFFPSPLPVTLHYSDLIARLLGLLSKLGKWNPDVLLGQIRESRWFL